MKIFEFEMFEEAGVLILNTTCRAGAAGALLNRLIYAATVGKCILF